MLGAVVLLVALAAILPTGILPVASPVAGGPPPAGPSNPSGVSPAVLNPVLTVSPPSGPVGATVIFSATGYAHGSKFTITWIPTAVTRTVVTACTNKTSATGTASCTYKIPATAGGNYTFTGTDGGGHSAATVFDVLPSLSVSPNHGPVGTVVIVAGSAFGSSFNTTVVGVGVVFNGATVCPSASTTTNRFGNFTCAFALPPAPGGVHAFVGTDTLHASAAANFTVVPKLVVAPAYAPGGMGFGSNGSAIHFTGTGFRSSGTVAVNWTVGTACAPSTSPSGGFNCTYTIPSEAPGGSYLFSATDGVNSASVPFTVTFLTPSSTAATNGTNLTIRAGGFSPNATVTVAGPGGTLYTHVSNASGGIPSFVYPVRYLAAGNYPFSAADGTGLTAGFTLTIVAALNDSPVGGPPLNRTVFVGTGFAAGAAVTISWTNGTICPGAVSNGSGGFRCVFVVPAGTAGGVYTFAAVDAAGHAARTTYTVTFLAALPPQGPVGTSVALSGGGFSPLVSFNVSLGGAVVCTGTTGPTGTFRCPATVIAAAPAGPLHFLAQDVRHRNATAVFAVVSQLSVRPASGAVGTAVAFSGTGFAAAASVTVSWSRGVACSNTTSSTGTFACGFVLPATPVGPYIFAAVDAASDTARASFGVVPHLTLSPSAGAVGTTVQLRATGFAPTVPLTISTPLALACSGATDTTGGFACSYSVPASFKSSLNFTAIDQSSDTASALFAVGSLLQATPLSGPVGTAISFVGTGFASSAGATVATPAGAACSGTTSAVGGFACSYVLPPTPAGPLAFTGSDSVGDTSIVSFTVTPSLVLNRTSGTVGAAVRATGAGFARNASVTVSAASATLCSAVTGTFGGFACSGTVPAEPAGNLSVVATDTANETASAVVRVLPSLAVSPTSGPVGTNLSFRGAGFAAVAPVAVGWAGGTVCTAASAANGSFACAATMPPATAGAHVFNATDTASNRAVATFTVVTSFSAGLTAIPSGGPPGTVVTLEGTGFAGAVTVRVNWSAGLACSNTSDSSGSFSCKFSIPLGTPGGMYSFTGSDGRGDSATATFTVTFLVAQPPTGLSGATVTFSGGGFTGSSAFTLTWTGGTACTGTTSATGVLACTFALPPIPAGPHTFTATDAGARSASATFTVLPGLSASVSRATVGTPVRFDGSNFAASSAFALTWAGGSACAGTTRASGAFSCNFTVPPTAEGLYAFAASDTHGNATSVAVSVVPSLLPSVGAGPVGASVTFVGAGFAGSVVATVNGIAPGTRCSATASTAGAFSCALTVPPAPGGTYAFVASQTVGGPTAGATFVVRANLTVVPVVGPTGTSLVFNATGFGSSVAVSVDWTGGTACTGQTTPSGAFGCTFYVPPSLPGGNTTFSAVDALGDSASTVYLVVPALLLLPNFGGPGTTVMFSGLGFAAGGAVTVTWSGGTACTAVANGSGAFGCTFTIPLGAAGGSYTFVATDAVGNRTSAPFVVTFVTLAPTTATVGTVLTFNGAGYAPGASFAVAGLGGTVCLGTTSGTGTFRCTYPLANTTAGSHTFTASDGTGDSASVTLGVVPSLGLAPGAGVVGSHLAFSGRGFAGALAVSVTWTAGAACNATTDAAGRFACSFTMPAVATGVYTFTAADAAGHRANATFDLTLPPTFNVSFVAAGLPAATVWTVVLNGASVSANTSTIVFAEPTGAYSFSVRSAGYLASPPSGTLSVSGAAVNVPVSFAAATYTVSFTESGLSGQSWAVTVGAATHTTTGPSIAFTLPNGTYNYSVGPVAGYTVSSGAGAVVVGGSSPAPVALTFSLVSYTVTFNETGLPSGASWNVTLNGVTVGSRLASITFARPNGTYTFDIQSKGYNATPWGGTVRVGGANPAAVLVNFVKTQYAVSFAASGIPATAPWIVSINGSAGVPVTGATYSINEPNGVYSWRVSAAGFKVVPSSGNLTVSGQAPPSIAVRFTAWTFPVTFTESGLPSGATWRVSFFAGPTLTSNTTTATMMLANGTYYVAYGAPSGYFANPTSTYVNVSGAKSFSVSMVSTATLAPSPPPTFLGFTGNTGYYVAIALVAVPAAVGGLLGYYFGGRKTRKTAAHDFL